ncbi:MAG: TonB-dependent receptor [Gammaproteobacteria bacterium]|nr:TonB-dependent receptor [Gammaproteobacteria bacterium]
MGDLGIEWQATYAEAERDKPDRQFFRYERSGLGADGTPIFQFSQSGQSNERSFEELDDESQSVGVDFSLPLQLVSMETTLKWGVSYTDRERDSSFRRFRFQTDFSRNNLEDVLGFAPDVVLRDANIGPGLFELREVTQPTDNYTAEESNTAFYLTADMRIGEKLQLSVGARREDSDIETTTFDRSDPTQQIVADLEDDDVLPALNVTYALTDSLQLRAGYSKTLNRPDLRELSPAPFIEPEERFVIIGNPNLKTAEIDNFDLRFEWYWSSLDNLQLALFYKDFKDPIESFVQFGGSNGGARSFQNALGAENQGIEVQVRSGLGRFGDALTDFFVKLNAAYIDSEVEVPDKRAADHQEPRARRAVALRHQFPAGLRQPGTADRERVAVHIADDRINAVGVRGLPHAIEKSAPRLDFNYRQVVSLFGSEWTVKFRALNLLDPDYEIKRGSIIERGYKLGRTVQLGLDYQF